VGDPYTPTVPVTTPPPATEEGESAENGESEHIPTEEVEVAETEPVHRTWSRLAKDQLGGYKFFDGTDYVDWLEATIEQHAGRIAWINRRYIEPLQTDCQRHQNAIDALIEAGVPNLAALPEAKRPEPPSTDASLLTVVPPKELA
jgi:hypothetical protein